MLARYVRQLFQIKPDPVKQGVHSVPRILDVNSKEVAGKQTRVQGWVYALRKMKTTIFADVTDGSTCQMLQVTIPKEKVPKSLSYGSSIQAEGELDLAPNNRTELKVNDIRVIGTCDVMDGYPFAPRKQYPPEYVRQYLHLRPKTRHFSSTLRLRDLASSEMNNYLRDRGFVSVHTPILTSNDCEGAGEIFIVKPDSAQLLRDMKKDGLSEEESYFNTKAYLTVSGQMHLEALARAFTKVYTFGPTFRAENSKSRLHLSEFYMIETELAFVTRVEEIVEEAELLVKSVTEKIFEKGALDLQSFNVSRPSWLDKKFNCLTYKEAVDILNNHIDKLEVPVKYGSVLSKEHELFLVKHNGDVPVFIVDWPVENKPFYMKQCQDNPSKVAAMDLLVPIVGELIGGGIREDNYENLKSKLPTTVDLSWYLDLRKYGNVPTGGFGLGFERYLQCILNISNIKDTIPFPRWPHNCSL